MDVFRTEVNVDESKLKVQYDSKLFCIGSCFAENIGAHLKGYKFRTALNPFGIVYNPLSIHNQLQMLLQDKTFRKEELFFHNETWNSFFHHGSFSGPDQLEVTANINAALSAAKKDLLKTDLMIITLGTAWVYEFLKTGDIVSNCHKVPDKEFRRFSLDVDKIVDTLGTTLQQLKKLNPKLNVMLTVSPIRHLKDGPVENQLSKAILLMAVHKMVKQNNFMQYFPAYELMMDDLRDYRFYNTDMIHPSPAAIEYIWEKFLKAYVDKRAYNIMAQVEEIIAARNHRPRNPQSESHKNFQKKALVKILQMKAAYPEMDFDEEIHFFKADEEKVVA